MSATKIRRSPALFNLGGARPSPERSAEFYSKYPDCPRPEPLDRLALPLEREKAEMIAAGTKTVEFRGFTPFYHSRLYDKDVMKWIDDHGNDKSISDEDFFCADPVRPIRTIHFYNYNKTWTLDVAVKETGIVSLTEDGIQMLHERFNCHEMDDNYAAVIREGIPENERPLYFYFAINSIINSTL